MKKAYGLAVLASGRGSNLEAILRAIGEGRLTAEVRAVFSDREHARALEIAGNHGVPAVWVDPAAYEDRAAYDRALLEKIRAVRPDCLVLAGYMRILSPWFVTKAGCPIVNIHPSLLPAFAGLNPHGQALASGVRFSGCTVHFVDEGVDTGPVVMRRTVPVAPGDTEESLAARVLKEEHILLPEVLDLMAKGRVLREGREAVILSEGGIKLKKRALVSVSDKTGLDVLGRGLTELGYEILSTGGTARALAELGIPVTKVSDATGFPEILDGRVKTLHPKIHGGILAKNTPEHLAQLKEMEITPIDFLAVNLYPFQATIAKENVRLEEAVEQIDIGGPSMIRSAAKNHERVIVLVSPAQYAPVLEALKAGGDIPLEERRGLAAKAFAHTAEYDGCIADFLANYGGADASEARGKKPDQLILAGTKLMDLRYGENPHQKAALYRWQGPRGEGGVCGARQLQGKELSYNNIVDLESAWKVACEFPEPAAAIIKHTNPCGIALGTDIADAYARALDADPVSAFGGVIGLNRTADRQTAEQIVKTFMEAVAAPGYTAEALEILKAKENLRLLRIEDRSEAAAKAFWIEPVSGGFLIQDLDAAREDAEAFRVVSKKKPDPETLEELLFAWRVVKHVKSNAIVLTRGKCSAGVGPGQTNRVGAVKIALEQAGEKARGAVLASDAFFPFGDSVELAAQYGVAAVIQPGGSLRDQESVDKADEHGMVMVFTDIRHFRH
jgi:phosphoribosylaminoimidazolecarboxamide formyltransferase/IMP cyclohydrolase